MTPIELISIIISLASITCVVATLVHNFSKDSKADIRSASTEMEQVKESLIKANIKLDQVCTTTNETRTDIKGLDKRIADQDKRLSIVERDVATAFIRIDEIREIAKGEV